jgi:putative endonuclease
MKFKRKGDFCVYIVQCIDGTYYTGSTKNLEERIKLHNNGNGAKYLRARLPVKLVYAKKYRYYKNVLCAERNIKKLTREKKEDLIKIYEKENYSFAITKLNRGAPMLRFSERHGRYLS